tara:strand:- start:16653 stop:16856 length:204 start_codon:yes stop_codon:yes gene_type:complete
MFKKLPIDIIKKILFYSHTTMLETNKYLYEEINNFSYNKLIKQKIKFSKSYAKFRQKQRLQLKLNKL